MQNLFQGEWGLLYFDDFAEFETPSLTARVAEVAALIDPVTNNGDNNAASIGAISLAVGVDNGAELPGVAFILSPAREELVVGLTSTEGLAFDAATLASLV